MVSIKSLKVSVCLILVSKKTLLGLLRLTYKRIYVKIMPVNLNQK